MTNKFGIFRTKEKMQEGLNEIKTLQQRINYVAPKNKELRFNQALIRYLELEGMLILAEAVAIGAIAREESRGSHYRTDYPQRNDTKFLKPVSLGIFEPKERVY